MSDLYGSPMGGGLMNIFANPQTAGLLGMAGGLLQASGPTRLPVSNGQALGMGLAGMGEGFNNALQMQRGMMQMRMLQGLMGDQGGGAPGSSAAPASASQPMAPVSGAANVGPLSGLSAGLGGMAPAPTASAASASSAYPASPSIPAGPSFGGKSPAQLMHEGQIWNLISPGSGNAMISAALSAQAPTDAQKMAGAAYGYGTPEYTAQLQAEEAKAKYIAPTAGRPGGYLKDPLTGQLTWLPNVPQGAVPQFNASGQFTGVAPMAGAADVARTQAAASAGGKAQYELKEVWDPSANAGKGGFVQQTVANAADAASGGGAQPGLPTPVPSLSPFQNAIRAAESGGSPAAANPASSAQGSMQVLNATAANPGFGVRPAQNDSIQERDRVGADYSAALHARYGNDADAAIAYHYGPGVADQWIKAGRPMDMLPPDARGYLTNVTNASRAYAGGTRPSGPMASQPPLGQTSMSNEAQAASAKVMADDYQNMQGVRQNAPTVLQAYDHLLELAKTGGLQGWAANGGITGKLMSTDAATYVSPAAAEYDKTRAFLINAGGAAMGEHNTDAARANLDRMIPEFGKPTQAKIDGITQARNQASMAALRANVMTPLFQAGDSKSYTGLANQFDTSVKPEMMPVIEPILNLPPQQQQAAAKAAYKANPALKPALAVLLQAGLLK